VIGLAEEEAAGAGESLRGAAVGASARAAVSTAKAAIAALTIGRLNFIVAPPGINL
jgi:hypothetical protein